ESVVNAALPGRRFLTSISQAVILPEVSGKGKTLFQLPRYTRLIVAVQYMHLAVEVERRVLSRDAFLAGQLDEPVFEQFGTNDVQQLAGNFKVGTAVNGKLTEETNGPA